LSNVTVDDVRRLIGPNVVAPQPLVVVDLALGNKGNETAADDATVERLRALYLGELARVREALGLRELGAPVIRRSRNIVTFGYFAPPDIMLACAEASEWAANSAVGIAGGLPPLNLETARVLLTPMLEQARNPAMVALIEEARRRQLPFLWDDEDVTVGEGRGSITYTHAAIPPVADVPWAQLCRIPVALVTGTNGKTTSTRLLAHVARTALAADGRVVGVSSSDGVVLGADTVEKGDWTGPAAARRVLRHRQIDLAVLETARGGILRRGLAVQDADVALLTNVSADHLGGYGVDDVEAMTEVKAVVARAARAGGTVVLNARDRQLVRLAASGTLAAEITFFADLDAGDEAASALLAAHRAAGGPVVFTRDGMLVAARGDAEVLFGRARDLPITFSGAARYNVENALGVIGAARGLGLPDEAIARGLTSFGSEDNPRRGQLVEKDGVRVFLDFGHNPRAVRAAMSTVTALRSGRLTVIMAAPGDRSDADIADVASEVFAANPDRIFVRELPHYLRGRSPGEVPEIFARTFHDLGFADDAFARVSSEVDGLERAFADAREGDVVVVLVHLDRDEVSAFLARPAPPS
jgi:cyanophycin synthetase